MGTFEKGKRIAGYRKKGTFLCVALVMVSLQLLFRSPVFAGRPLTTDDATTVEPGKLQLETGFDILRQENHDRETSPSLTLTFGLSERADVGIGSAYFFVRSKEGEREKGLGDTGLKLKYRFFEEGDGIPALAVAGKLKIPTASESKGLGSGKLDFGIHAISTKNLSKRILLHLNLGYTFIGEHRVDNDFHYSGAVQFALSEKWHLVGEVVGVNNFNGRKGDDPISGLLGTYYVISENVIWDAGVEIGMSKAAPDFRITTGLTVFFKP